MDLSCGIDECKLGLSGYSRYHGVNPGEFVLDITTISVINGDDLPSFGNEAGVWLKSSY
jgi:hypothetical protein